MSSIIKEVECPNCKSRNCNQEYSYKKGKYLHFCENCGYEETLWIKTDDNGEIELLDPELGLDLRNVLIEDADVEIPYGVATISFIDKVKVVKQLKTKRHYKRLKKQYSDLNSIDNDVKEVTVRRYLYGEFFEEPLFQRYYNES